MAFLRLSGFGGVLIVIYEVAIETAPCAEDGKNQSGTAIADAKDKSLLHLMETVIFQVNRYLAKAMCAVFLLL